jgi:hypothetical protein
MGRLSKDALLGASDLEERDVELPSIGGSVRIRSLPAAYSQQAMQEAIVQKTEGREQVTRYDLAKLRQLQVLHALVDPKLESIAEAREFAEHCGPAFETLVDAIDDISGINAEELEAAERRFPGGGEGSNGADVGSGDADGGVGPDVHVRAGA